MTKETVAGALNRCWSLLGGCEQDQPQGGPASSPIKPCHDLPENYEQKCEKHNGKKIGMFRIAGNLPAMIRHIQVGELVSFLFQKKFG